MPSILEDLKENLEVKYAHLRDSLLREIDVGKHPVCLIEHEVAEMDPKEVLSALIDPDVSDVLMSRFQLSLSNNLTAYKLLPDLIDRSPNTKFVITSHVRGSGIPSEVKSLYKRVPEVAKVMGFINANSNYRYLLKLFSRVYYGKTWKREPLEEI